jgi:hypothetical protein
MNLWQSCSGIHRVEAPRPSCRTGDYASHVEVESDYQVALEQIVGGRSEDEVQFECTAFLVPESDNPDEPNAVAVHISGWIVGYLDREESEQYCTFLGSSDLNGVASCDAFIYGGWKRQESEGYFAVRLDLEWPLRLQEEVPQT